MMTEQRLVELSRLHAEAVVNKGGDFEIDTDEAFRIAMMEDAPKLIEDLRKLRAETSGLLDALSNLGDFYEYLDDEPDGAIPAWDLVAMKMDDVEAAMPSDAGGTEG